jgi:MFS transporter, DHA2 family, multidrug resistance protein
MSALSASSPDATPGNVYLTKGDARRWWILAACCTIAFAQLAEPQLWMIGLEIPASAFGTAWREYRALANLGVILFVAFQLIGGVIGDLFGRRRILLIGAIGSTVWSVLALAAWDLPVLVVARGLRGIFGALAFPLALGIIRLTFVGEERKIALLIYTFATAVGILASLIVIPIEYHFGWRWGLVLPIVAGSVGCFLAWRSIPESRARGGMGRGEAVASAAWTLVFLTFIFGLAVARTSGGLNNAITLTAGVAGILGMLVMVFWSRRPAQSGLFRRANELPRNFLSMMLLVSATQSFALSGYVLQLYQFFFNVQQYSGLIAGLALAPIVLGNLFFLRRAGKFAIEQPRHLVVGSGLGAMGIAILLTSLARPGIPYLALVPMLMLFGLGFLVTSAAWAYFFFSALPPDLAGTSSGINRAAGLVGGAMAGVVLSAIVEATGMANFKQRLADVGLSEAQKEQAYTALTLLLRGNEIGVESLQQPDELISLGLLSAYREAYSVAIASAMIAVAVVCLIVGVIAWIWLRRIVDSERIPESALVTV